MGDLNHLIGRQYDCAGEPAPTVYPAGSGQSIAPFSAERHCRNIQRSDFELGRDRHLRPITALQHVDRLSYEFRREILSNFLHQTFPTFF
ncbi:hypothetical protein [Methylobacterium sp. GXS13]|uniref:hypothetical protein n=1 Tax=Methylobacterium sp. GXS13 TaxID=1730094 RepID=UPI00128F9BC9|nr:hypothetical protein [Methylobacterium sp. GXS13]